MKKEFFKLSNSYAKLPKVFYEKIKPKPVKNPRLIHFNINLSKELNIDPNIINEENGKLIFSGNIIPKGANPIAMAYAGHQFGNFVPQLGDGRAILLGELFAKNGERYDLQLKGSGRTAFSRNGDGRSPLGPVIREYLISESLHYLGINSTRSLAIVSTGEDVFREKRMPGGVLTRIASSHIRIGTFEFFSYKNDIKSLKALADYTLKRHFKNTPKKNPYKFLLKNVLKSQAELISKWMSVGFIHGVMNTDNTTISGETIDFGPCAFMDQYNPHQVFSYIDEGGRYSYINQGKIIFWNLAKFAESLLPILSDNTKESKKHAMECLEVFPSYFEKRWLNEMKKKIGLSKHEKEDHVILNEFFEILRTNNLDFTLSFRKLSKYLTEVNDDYFCKNVRDKKKLNSWVSKWKKRLSKENLSFTNLSEKMENTNPLYIPRNHIVERIIESSVSKNDFTEMKRFLKVIQKPFSEDSLTTEYTVSPKKDEIVPFTFCGT